MDEFCYLSNVITKTSSCDKEIRTRVDIKANSTRLDDLKSEKSEITDQDQVPCINCTLSVLLCSVETWRAAEVNLKCFETFNHNCLPILDNCLRDSDC